MQEIRMPEEVFLQWGQIIEANAEEWKNSGGSYRWIVQGPGGGDWLLDCGDVPQVTALVGDARGTTTSCQVSLDADCLDRLAGARLNPQTAFLAGQIRVAGDLQELLRLASILEKLITQNTESA